MSDYKIEEVFNKLKLLNPKKDGSQSIICETIRVDLEFRTELYSGEDYFVSAVYKHDKLLFEMSQELFYKLSNYTSKTLTNDEKIDNFLETF